MPMQHPAGCPCSSEAIRQGPQGAHLPAVAGDRNAAGSAAQTSAASKHEPLFTNRYGRAPRCRRCAVQARAIRAGSGGEYHHCAPSTCTHTRSGTPREFSWSAAGVDVTVIRSWLGHVSLDTTNHYARANIETKRRALELVDRSTRPSGRRDGGETPSC